MKLNSEFYEKKELEENLIYSFKPIRKKEKKNSIGVKADLDSTIFAYDFHARLAYIRQDFMTDHVV